MKHDRSEPQTLEVLAATAADPDVWELRLYVAGKTAKSVAAFENLKSLCEEHLSGTYNIEVVDLLVHPQLAKGDQIIAIPTLVRKLPQPIRKIIGDLSNTERTLVGLQLRPRKCNERRIPGRQRSPPCGPCAFLGGFHDPLALAIWDAAFAADLAARELPQPLGSSARPAQPGSPQAARRAFARFAA